MLINKENSLIIFLDFSNQALRFNIYSGQFNLQQMIQKCTSILQEEINKNCDFSIIINESAKFVPKFLFNQCVANKDNIDQINLILNKQKQVFLKKISGKHMKKKSKNKIFQPSFNQIIYKIQKMTQYFENQIKLVLILDYDYYLAEDLDNFLEYSIYNKSKLQIKICFYNEQFQENQGQIGKLIFQERLQDMLYQKEIVFYKNYTKKLSFKKNYEQEFEDDAYFKQQSDYQQAGQFQHIDLDIELYIMYLQPLEWQIKNSVIDEWIILQYKDEQFKFIMKINQNNKEIVVYSLNSKKYTFQNFVNYLEETAKLVISIDKKTLEKCPEKFCEILKKQKLQVLRQIFNFKYFCIFVDDYIRPQQVDKYLNDFLDYIQTIKLLQIFQNQYLVQFQKNIFLIAIAKASRNLFIIEIMDFQFGNSNLKKLKQLKRTLKNKIIEYSKSEILILSNKLRNVIQIHQNYKNISNSIKLKYASEYYIHNFPYQIYKSPLEKSQMIEADTIFFNKKASHLFFYKNYIEEAISRHCKSHNFYLFVNRIKKKFQLIFFKTYKSNNKNASYAKHYILFFIIKYQNEHIQNIKTYIRTEDPSKNICPLKLQDIKNDAKLLIDQFELPNIMLQIYYQLLNNIKKNLITTPKDFVKKQLKYLKFDVPIKFFKLQDTKLDSNKQPNYEQKLKLLNLLERFTLNKNTLIERIRSRSNKITQKDIETIIKVSVFDKIIDLQCFSDEELNKNLLSSYMQTLSKYSDHKYNFGSSKNFFFLKFMHPETFCILYFNFDFETKQEIFLNFHIICLKCFKENLGQILSQIQNSDFEQRMKNLQDTLECKFRDKIQDSKKINNFYTGKMLSNLHFLFQVDYNLFFKQRLQNQQSFSKIFSELSKSSTYTDDMSQSLTFTKILQIQNQKGYFFCPQLINDLQKIFDLIYNCFFVKINTQENSQKGGFYLLNTEEKIPGFDKLSRKIYESPIIKLLESNLTNFVSYIKQISNNINFFLIQIQLHVQKNLKLSLNNFEETIKELKQQTQLDNAKIQFQFSKNFVKKKDNKISRDLYQQIKLSPYRNELLKNKYYHNIYYTAFYIYEFEAIRKKISKIIMTILESFFSCVYLELFLLNPKPNNTNSYKMLCKNLENCRQIFVINYQSLPQENFNLIENVYKKLKKMNKYVLEKIGKNKQSIKGISIIPLKTNDKFVLNYVFKKTKVEILIYESLTLDKGTLEICKQCKNFLNCLSSEPKTTYFSILQTILTFSHLNITELLTDKDEQNFQNKNYCCIQLCNTLEDILNIIYEKNARDLLEKILYNKVKDLNKFLEQQNTGFQSKNQPFLKIIDVKKFQYMELKKNKNMYDQLIGDLIFQINKKEENLFFTIIEGESYLLKIEKDDETEKETQIQTIVIYFYGVKNEKSTIHIQKIYNQIKERINNILGKQIKELYSRITLMNRDLKIIKNIQYNYYYQQFSIKIPNINKTMLILYFSQNLQKYFIPIQGQIENYEKKLPIQYVFNINEINFKDEKVTKFFVTPQVEDFQFLSIYDDEKEHTLIGETTIFQLHIQNSDLPIFYNRYMDTKDGFFIHDLLSLDQNTNQIKLSDFFHVQDKHLLFKKKKFYQLKEEFKLFDKHIDDHSHINLEIQTQKKSSSEDIIIKKIYHILQLSLYDYFVELLMSMYLLKDQNKFSFKKSFTNFIEFLKDLKNCKQDQEFDLDSSFQYNQIDNAYFRTYTFQSFLEITKIITEEVQKKNFDLKIYYIYQNQEFEDKLQIIEQDFNNFQECINFYFEERDQLFKNTELDFTLLIVPADMQFDSIENNFKNYIQERKHRFQEDNIFLSKVSQKKTHRHSLNIQNKNSIAKKQVSTSFSQNSINKNYFQNLDVVDVENNNIDVNYSQQQMKKLKEQLIQQHKYKQRLVIQQDEQQNSGQQYNNNLPPRRFFLITEFKNRKVDFFTYNIKKTYITEIQKKIQSYMNLTSLKNDLQKQISLQKLGISTMFDMYQDAFQNQSSSNEYYLEKIEQVQKKYPNFDATHFTNIIELVFNEGINNKGLVELVQDKDFVQRIVKDFSRIQFSLINAYESRKVELTAFYKQRMKSYSIDNLMQNFFKLSKSYFEKRIFEERLKKTLTLSNQNFGSLNFFLKELLLIQEVEYPFFYMDYNYFEKKDNYDIQSFSEVIQKEKSINVQGNDQRTIYP